MLKVRRASDRGHADHGWLNSYHSFSFADYHDPAHMGFGVLRVINEDRIQGGTGFGRHGHHDMEIISYVLAGALEHQDSMGNRTLIRPGEVQRMSAGTGVEHSEINFEKDRESHFLQIWVLPDRKGYPPSYAQKSFSPDLAQKSLVLVASKAGRDNSLSINQDADVYLGKAKGGETLPYRSRPERKLWLQMISGDLQVDAHGEKATLGPSDGLAMTDISELTLHGTTDVDFILFDMPAAL